MMSQLETRTERTVFVDQGIAYVTLGIPTAEIAVLKETLRLSKNREKDPVKWIEQKAVDSCVALASSTVEVSSWKDLEALAGKLGVESPV